ncbi:thiolase family protein [Glaciimonas immobilis]|uniref:Acetyl-CoA C-acetyltransferase n=1 Tax=Glaciimonas immobilis TaxID=728004 RepID=A0A840RRQ6_9BURK|nr:thiolase family protein [Glaciimonas immobilis]KAF3996482.1 thiolase family protein [Glaciimonas immobilis]MBB5201167.1 acetyl-CoA C-acetyltransferase [Glaciimonas immobilis]
MPLNRPTAVIGSAIMVPILSERRSLEEILYEVAQAALKSAGIPIEDIDGILVASNDQVDGRAISIMAASGSVGGVDRDILSTPSAGEHAFVMGVLRIASAHFETQLVVSWGVTEASSLSEVERLGADPYFHRRLPLDDLSSFALQANALTNAHPQASELAAKLVEQNRHRGAKAYPEATGPVETAKEIAASKAVRWPVREAMMRTPTTGAVALVLASEDYVKKAGITNPAWMRGMGWATEAAFLGDRDLTAATALQEAARQAFADAGIASIKEIDVAEISAATPYQELLAYQALGIAEPAQWAEVVSAEHAHPTLNLSGGVASINPVFCGGLVRIAEAANQIMGTAGKHQAANVTTALAHATSGPAMMYQTVVVFGSNLGGTQ